MKRPSTAGWAAALGGALLLVSGCATHAPSLPPSPVAAGDGIRIVATPVELWPSGAPPVRSTRFSYAGGLVLTSPDTSRFHGLSDLEAFADGRMVAVSDEGDLIRGRIILDGAGRLIGLGGASLTPLDGLNGQPVSGDKADSDAEGLAIIGDGAMLVSFERRHRIWLYPAGGGVPRPAPAPDSAFPDNDGMEALAPDPARGADAYIVGREDTRQTWTCRLSTECAPGPTIGDAGQGKLVAARALTQDRWAWLLRDYNPLTGVTIHLLITDRTGAGLDVLKIAPPATVDNFEGLSAQERPDGGVRFYILSDDNFSASQRTLMLAFDWR